MIRAAEGLRRVARSQIARFLILGGLAAAINWLVRFPLSALMSFEAAVFFAYLIGMSAGFVLYGRCVFPGSNRPIIQQIALFLAVNAGGALAVLVSASLLLNALAGVGLPLPVLEGFAHGTGIGLSAVVNFLGHRWLTFAVRPERLSGDGE